MGILAALATMRTWPWRLIGIIVLWLAVIGALFFFGRYLYALGARDENERWENRVEKLETRAEEIADEAESNHREVTARINSTLAHETEQLEGIADDADDMAYLIAWARADQRLLDSAIRSGEG